MHRFFPAEVVADRDPAAEGKLKTEKRGATIRRLAPALCALLLLVIAPRPSSAAPPLALPHSDYPHGSTVAVVPATDAAADTYLAPAHRSTFEQLGRVDGSGWLQFATWHFTTGLGGARERHQTNFGYGINLFRNAAAARAAVRDVRLKTHAIKVAHLAARLYRSSDPRETLVFTFFVYKLVEVEAYYEYSGVAPATVDMRLRHVFSRQRSHLARLAKKLNTAIRRGATATPTDTATVPTSTATAAPTATATALPTATMTPSPSPTAVATPTETATATATPSPTATPTPFPLGVRASMSSPFYPPGASATLQAQVSRGDQPVAGATIVVTFRFPDQSLGCQAKTGAAGDASCSVTVPAEPDGTQVQVQVEAIDSSGQTAFATTLFIVHSS